MTIKVLIKSVYGNELIYPMCDKAKSFAQIADCKTLTRTTIKLIKELGYSIEIIPQSL